MFEAGDKNRAKREAAALAGLRGAHSIRSGWLVKRVDAEAPERVNDCRERQLLAQRRGALPRAQSTSVAP
jgi:hypothetical protein